MQHKRAMKLAVTIQLWHADHTNIVQWPIEFLENLSDHTNETQSTYDSWWLYKWCSYTYEWRLRLSYPTNKQHLYRSMCTIRRVTGHRSTICIVTNSYLHGNVTSPNMGRLGCQTNHFSQNLYTSTHWIIIRFCAHDVVSLAPPIYLNYWVCKVITKLILYWGAI